MTYARQIAVTKIQNGLTIDYQWKQHIYNNINEFDLYYYSILKRMSRGNVFKLSGNMALGGGNNQYGSTDIQQIKSSLKLLKQKKNQRQSLQEQYNNNYATNSYTSHSKNGGYGKQDYNYDSTLKNLPSSQKDSRSEYNNKNYKNNEVENIKKNTNYEYSNKPPSYPQQNNTRNSRNVQSLHQPQIFQNYQASSSKNNAAKVTDYQNKAYNTNSSKQQQQKQQFTKRVGYNEKQQRNIKQVNRENQVDIVQYDPSQLIPCKVCDRKFNPNSIKKHEANCKQVFQKKRKQYNAQQHRIVDNQQKKLMKKGQAIEKKLQAQQKNQKIPKWKAQSMAFRVALKQTRNEDIDPRQAAIMQQAQEETGVKCPHCNRKFNDTAGPRHIKFCQEQSKKNSLKKKK